MNLDSEERVIRLADSKAVVAFMTFEVSRDIRDVRILEIKGKAFPSPERDEIGKNRAMR